MMSVKASFAWVLAIFATLILPIWIDPVLDPDLASRLAVVIRDIEVVQFPVRNPAVNRMVEYPHVPPVITIRSGAIPRAALALPHVDFANHLLVPLKLLDGVPFDNLDIDGLRRLLANVYQTVGLFHVDGECNRIRRRVELSLADRFPVVADEVPRSLCHGLTIPRGINSAPNDLVTKILFHGEQRLVPIRLFLCIDLFL